MKKSLHMTATPLLISTLLIGLLIAAFASSVSPVAAQDGSPVVDELPNVPGINVKLGPWTIMDQTGWSDINAITSSVCVQLKDALGIMMSPKFVDWGTNDADAHAFNYDFFAFCMHSGAGTMYDRYYQMFVGTDYYWNHYGDYRNPELTELIRQLDITTGAAQQTVADQILTIIGQQLPLIPHGTHPDWYMYSDLYWDNFPNEENNQIMPDGPYGGTAQCAVLQKIVLGLENKNPPSGLPTPTSGETVPRQDAMYTGGYEGSPDALKPTDMPSGNAGMAMYFMYEPMFGVNLVDGSLVKVLGESIEWIDNYTIEVTLRNDAYWTDGTPITSADAVNSYRFYGAVSGISWAAGDAGPMAERVDSWEIIDNQTFRVHINENYPNSSAVYTHLVRSYVILPEHVWDLIEDNYGANMRTFTNDWQDSAMVPDEWKVASGMYLPYWHASGGNTIMIRNDNWWGKDVWGLPKPKYIVHIKYNYANAPAAMDLMAGNLDWCGKYMGDIGTVMSRFPFVHTYYLEGPLYFADKAVKLLVPNHRVYPLNEDWLHRAIVTALDYETLSATSSGYLKIPDFTLLPVDDASARALCNPTVLDEYAIVENVDTAFGIIAEHCYLIDSSGNIIANPTSADLANGTWYTKDGPSADWYALYGVTPPTTTTTTTTLPTTTPTTTTTTAPPSEVWNWVAVGIGVVVVIAVVALVLTRKK